VLWKSNKKVLQCQFISVVSGTICAGKNEPARARVETFSACSPMALKN